MHKMITVLLIIVGTIHILPISGMLGPEHLSSLYGLSFQESNISILIRHRALLFGLLGLFLIYAAFRPTLQPVAFVAGSASVISFIAIASSVGNYNDAIRKIVLADIVALVCLIIAIFLYIISHRQS